MCAPGIFHPKQYLEYETLLNGSPGNQGFCCLLILTLNIRFISAFLNPLFGACVQHSSGCKTGIMIFVSILVSLFPMGVLAYRVEIFVFQITSNGFSVVGAWKGDRGWKIPVVED